MKRTSVSSASILQHLREWLPRSSRYPRDLSRFISRWDDDEFHGLFSNLGGHDFSMLQGCLLARTDELQGPTVVFAYTFKGWMIAFDWRPS